MECFIRKRGDWMIQDGEVLNQKKQHNHTLCGFFMECFIRKRGDWINCVDPSGEVLNQKIIQNFTL